MPNELKTVYSFNIKVNREVDKTTSRTEDGKTITETTKVTEPVPLYFMLKVPSRAERELAEEERAAWWSHYVEKGILPKAILLKTYANYGHILSDEQRNYYSGLQADYLLTEQESERVFISEPANEDKKRELATKLVNLRNDILSFEQTQAIFFDNTAEAKANIKMTQYLVLHLSYTRSDDTKDWEPLFKGGTTKDKLVTMDKLVDAEDEVYARVYPLLSFVAHLYSSNGGVNSEALNEYFAEVNSTQGVVS